MTYFGLFGAPGIRGPYQEIIGSASVFGTKMAADGPALTKLVGLLLSLGFPKHQVCIHVYVYLYLHIYIYICICLYMYMCMYMCM